MTHPTITRTQLGGDDWFTPTPGTQSGNTAAAGAVPYIGPRQKRDRAAAVLACAQMSHDRSLAHVTAKRQRAGKGGG
ncbi:MAG: hypothetical protein WC977_11000 [Anaerovoracaceae bacterium]